MDKDISTEDFHESLRKKFWCDIYLAYVGAANSTHKEGACIWADFALNKFDEKFPIKKESK
jgi:hypothetical protein